MNLIDQVMQRARARMLLSPNGSQQAEILYMGTEDLKVWAQWRNYLPSYFDDSEAARARLKKKIAARKLSTHHA